MSELTTKQIFLLRNAERAIQGILLELDEELEEDGLTIDHVNVDERNFANSRVEISTRPGRKS